MRPSADIPPPIAEVLFHIKVVPPVFYSIFAYEIN